MPAKQRGRKTVNTDQPKSTKSKRGGRGKT